MRRSNGAASCADRRSAGSTTPSRRTCPSCPPRAGRACRSEGRDVHPLLVRGERRHALRPVVLDLGQQQWQLVVRQGNEAAVVAVDDGNRGAPVALPREAPVAQAIRDGRLRLPLLLQRLDDRLPALVGGHPVVLAGVDEDAVLRHDLDDGQVERLGELAVALVVRRHGHDRAGAVLHQHVVGDVHGQPARR